MNSFSALCLSSRLSLIYSLTMFCKAVFAVMTTQTPLEQHEDFKLKYHQEKALCARLSRNIYTSTFQEILTIM